MKTLVSIFILLLSFNVSGQETYFSPLTEHLKTGQKEQINRTIQIDEGLITIKTELTEGYDIQTLKILEKKLNSETNPPILIYDCTSPDGVYPTLLFIPQGEIISEILIIQPSIVDGTDDHFRLHIETREKLSQ